VRIEVSRVFVSYDRAHDGDLRDRLLAEARSGSLFAVAASSEAAADADGLDERIRERIAAADAVIVICGEHTDECPGVSNELRITREEQKPHLLLWGRRAAMCKKPAGAKVDDSMYGWTPEILRAQLQMLMRVKRDVPDHLRRQPGAPKAGA
jgi:MTH538 TIR-like domain (DUF1863)